MSAGIVRGDASSLPLRNDSVDLVITSPPYFALRSYQDEGEHYEGQLGSEPTPQEFLDSLVACTAEMARVLKASGSIFVNLGDKYAGSGGHNNASIAKDRGDAGSSRRTAPDKYNKASGGVRAKSLIGLPWRYAIQCIDELGLILRSEIIWNKRNGLPDPAPDRVRRAHEHWFHFVKAPRYYSAVDELREPDEGTSAGGRSPGSVWDITLDPLRIPQWAKDKYKLDEHFAAFPLEWPRRIIRGWSPPGICLACGEGRFPVVERWFEGAEQSTESWSESRTAENQWGEREFQRDERAKILGYACKCTPYIDHPAKQKVGKSHRQALADGDGYASREFGTYSDRPKSGQRREYLLNEWDPAETRPAVVLDPFGGTGTVALVAKALGRFGISHDLSGDYSRLARWRIFESGHGNKAVKRTQLEMQQTLI